MNGSNQFSCNLRVKRTELGWTQAKAAEEVSKKYKYSITEERYQAWELGRSEPELDLLKVIVEIYQVDDMYLFLYEPIRKSKRSTKFLHSH